MKKRYVLMGVLTAIALAGMSSVSASEQSHSSMKTMGQVAAAEGQAVRAEGVVKAIQPEQAKITINHGPIPSLNWPAMTMDFPLEDKAVAAQVKGGDKVRFEFLPDSPRGYLITRIEVMDE